MKKWLLGLSAVAAIVGGILFWGYQFYFNRDVSEKDVNVEEGFFDFTDIVEDEPPTEESLTLHPQKTPPSKGNETEKSESGQPTGKTPSGSKQTPAPDPRNEQRQRTDDGKEERIRAKYYPKFKQLEAVARSRLDQLVKNAMADYKQSQKTGQPSMTELASRYMSAANKLQDGVDSAFYKLLGQMKKELREAGLPNDLAAEAERTYKNAIEQKKSELFSYALKAKNGGK